MDSVFSTGKELAVLVPLVSPSDDWPQTTTLQISCTLSEVSFFFFIKVLALSHSLEQGFSNLIAL